MRQGLITAIRRNPPYRCNTNTHTHTDKYTALIVFTNALVKTNGAHWEINITNIRQTQGKHKTNIRQTHSKHKANTSLSRPTRG